MALTRQRESAQVFVARETARDTAQLARQMAREEINAASVAWATADELAPELRAHVRQKEHGERSVQSADAVPQRAAEAAHRPGDVAQPPVADLVSPAQPVGEHERAALEILIPAYVDAAGRDSRGWGLDPANIAAAVAKDRAVQQARGAAALPARRLSRSARGQGAA